MNTQLINNRYRILKELGSGLSGKVYYVEDTVTHKKLALKTLSAHQINRSVELRFKSEFQLISKLRHPNLVEVYDFGSFDTEQKLVENQYLSYYFTMEYVPGESILKVSRKDNFNLIYHLLREVCYGLEYLHSQELVHSDLKPANILVTSEKKVKLLDFGLTKSVDDFSEETRGTISYMAPEMLKGTGIDLRVDLYSLGVIFYQIFTGHLPFEYPDTFSLIRAHLEETPPSPRKYNANISSRLEKIIFKMLAKEPDKRYASISEILSDLSKLTKVEVYLPKISRIFNSQFVGRKKELAKLKQVFSSPKERRLVLISGEAGVGKTYLTKEFKLWTQLNNSNFFTASCTPESSITYEAFVKLLTQLINIYGITKKYIPVLSKIIPGLKYQGTLVELEPKAEKLRLFNTINSYLIKLAKSRNIVLVIEDLHCTDLATIELLQYLARNLKNKKIIILATYRTEEMNQEHLRLLIEEGNALKINLRRFKEQEIKKMIGSMLGTKEVDEELVHWVFKESAGNPLFIDRLVRNLADEKIIFREKEKWQVKFNKLGKISLPENIEKLINLRLNQLSNKAINLAKIASIFQTDFDLELLENICKSEPLFGYTKNVLLGENVFLDSVNELIRKLVFESVGEYYQFAHPKIQEVLYNGLSRNKRKELHLKIGNILLEKYHKDMASKLAYHFQKAGDKEKAIKYSLLAGEQAEKRYAHNEAIMYYEYVVKNTKKIDKKLELLERIGKLYIVKGKYFIARKTFFKWLKLSSLSQISVDKITKVYSAIAYIYNTIEGNSKKTLIYLRKATSYLAQAKQLNIKSTDLIEAYNIISDLYLQLDKIEKAINYATVGLKLAEEVKHLEKISIFLILLSEIYKRQNKNQKEIKKYLDKGLNIAQKSKKLFPLSLCYRYFGRFYINSRQWDKALFYYQKALKISKKIGNIPNLIYSLNDIGLVYGEKGNTKLAFLYFRKSLNIAIEIGEIDGISTGYTHIGHLYQKEGKRIKAMKYFQKAMQLSSTLPPYSVSHINFTLGIIYLELGKWNKAIFLLQKSIKEGKKSSHVLALIHPNLAIGSIYIKKGFFSEAQKYINKALKITIKLSQNEYLLGLTYIPLFSLLIEKFEFRKAKDFLAKAIQIFEKLQNKRKLMICWLTSIEIALFENKIEEAAKLANKISKSIYDLKDKGIEASYYLLVGRINHKKENWQESIKYFRQSIEIFKELKLPYELGQSYYWFGIMYKDQGLDVLAKEQLIVALKIFKKLGAMKRIEETKQALTQIKSYYTT